MKIRFSTLSLGAVSALSLLPTASMAQSRDTWRAASVVSAAAAVFGIANHDPKLAIIGTAGAIYAASRASDDCDRYYYDSYGRRHIIVVTNPRYERDWDWDRHHRREYVTERYVRDDRGWGRYDRNRREWNRDDRGHRETNRDRGDRGRREDPFGRNRR